MIQSGHCKVETALTKDLPAQIMRRPCPFAASGEGLNSENGNLLPETGKIVQPRQQTVQ